MMKKRVKKLSFLNNKKANDFNFFKFFVVSWFFLFLFLGMAFAGFTTSLETEGMATFQAHIYDYVYISSIRISDSSNASNLQYSFLDHEINANVAAPTCDGYVTYEMEVVNTTPYKAFFTGGAVTSMINGVGNQTNTIAVDLYDVVFNDTYIDPHSTKTVHVKLKNNCSGSDDQVRVKANFEYSLYKYFDLTVNCDLSDATVSITTQEGTFTGTGTVTHRVYEGETATFKANKKYYYEGTGSYTMGTADHTETLTLVPDPHRDLTITTNVSSSTIVVKQNNEVICSGTGELVCSVVSGENVTYTVDDPEYYYSESGGVYSGYEETFMMPVAETTKNVTLQERPWITGTTSNSSSTSAKTYSGTNWHAGYYLIEAWGGKGGTAPSANGGDSGYVYGVVYIPYETTTYRTAGGNGTSGNTSADPGANGGGNIEAGSSGLAPSRGSGGGYSAFAVGATTINGTNINNGKVKVIAGAGGGGAAKGGLFNQYNGGAGGAGATLSNMKSTISSGTVFTGSDGQPGNNTGQGYGGSTIGGAGGLNGGIGTLLQGGDADQRGGGGGAGYYGGGGGGGARTTSNTGPGGGGGGSSFLASDVTYSGLSSTITSKLRGTNPSSTGGAVIVTWIGKTM